MRALRMRYGAHLKDWDIKEAVENFGGSIHYPHRDKQFLETRIYHKYGTVQVSGNYSTSYLKYLSPCHAFTRRGTYNLHGHRMSWYGNPHCELFGIDERYTISSHSVNHRYVLRYFDIQCYGMNKKYIPPRILYRFRKIPAYWIDWECLILTLNLAGKGYENA